MRGGNSEAGEGEGETWRDEAAEACPSRSGDGREEQSGAETGEEAGLGRVTRRGEGECAGRKAEVVEDGANNVRGGDVGQDAPMAAALETGQDVDLEGTAKQLGPGKPVMPGRREGCEQPQELQGVKTRWVEPSGAGRLRR